MWRRPTRLLCPKTEAAAEEAVVIAVIVVVEEAEEAEELEEAEEAGQSAGAITSTWTWRSFTTGWVRSASESARRRASTWAP